METVDITKIREQYDAKLEELEVAKAKLQETKEAQEVARLEEELGRTEDLLKTAALAYFAEHRKNALGSVPVSIRSKYTYPDEQGLMTYISREAPQLLRVDKTSLSSYWKKLNELPQGIVDVSEEYTVAIRSSKVKPSEG